MTEQERIPEQQEQGARRARHRASVGSVRRTSLIGSCVFLLLLALFIYWITLQY